MAHNLIGAVAENPGQENFILFCGKGHMLSVAKQVSDFIKSPDSFASYRRPPQVIGDDILANEKSGTIRDELIKTYALGQLIYEQDFDSMMLPFVHTQSDLSKLIAAR